MRKIKILPNILWVVFLAAFLSSLEMHAQKRPSPDCKADFRYVTKELNVTFKNKSVGNASKFFWDFGDGTTDINENTRHTYEKAGSYKVTLTIIKGKEGKKNYCKDAYTQVVEVKGRNNVEVCKASFNYEVGAGNQVVFTGTTKLKIQDWAWDFGDGTTARGQKVSHTYKKPGDYNVCLKIFAPSIGMLQVICEDKACQKVTIGRTDTIITPKCVTSFEFGKGDNFGAKFGAASGARNYVWTFGDGTKGYGQNTLHSFPKAGEYKVCLKAYFYNEKIYIPDSLAEALAPRNACIAYYCATVNFADSVKRDFCQAQVFNKTSNLTAYFSDSFGQSNPAANTFVKWSWNFGDGQKGEGAEAKHTYASPGKYYVTLIKYAVEANPVIKCKGNIYDTIACNEKLICKSSYAFFVKVSDSTVSRDCKANFIYEMSKEGGILFSNLSSAPYPNTQYYWSFGDGTTSNETSPTHIYRRPGKYEACLTLVSNPIFFGKEGDIRPDSSVYCKDQYCFTVVVDTPIDTIKDTTTASCRASYLYSVSGQSLQVVDDFWITAKPKPGVILGFHYDFGDGSSAKGLAANHTYKAPGLYNVCYTISAYIVDTTIQCISEGYYDEKTGLYIKCQMRLVCQETACKTIKIGEREDTITNYKSSFTYGLIGDNKNVIAFKNNSTAGANARYFWDFGDGTNSTEFAPLHSFDRAGKYNVCLTVTSSNSVDTIYYYKVRPEAQCKDQSCDIITIGVIDTVEISNCFAEITQSTRGNFAILSDDAYNEPTRSDLVTYWTWRFDDGSIAKGQKVIHEFKDGGKHSATLIKAVFSQPKRAPGTVDCAAIFTDTELNEVFHGCSFKEICREKYTITMATREVITDVFPNPIIENGTITVDGLGQNYDVTIYNTSGTPVKTLKNVEQKGNFSKEGLTEGLHFYSVYSNGELVSKGKFMVK